MPIRQINDFLQKRKQKKIELVARRDLESNFKRKVFVSNIKLKILTCQLKKASNKFQVKNHVSKFMLEIRRKVCRENLSLKIRHDVLEICKQNQTTQ